MFGILRRKQGCDNPTNGFTLLEVLVALGLISLLTVALYGSYFTVFRARERAGNVVEQRREISQTLDLIRKELTSLQFRTQESRLKFVVEDRDNFGKPSSFIEFTTLASSTSLERKESGIVLVGYHLKSIGDNRYRLVRQERDCFMDTQAMPEYPQIDQITSFLVECHNGSAWVKSWNTDPAFQGRVPKLVRITIQTEFQGKSEQFSILAVPKVSAQ